MKKYFYVLRPILAVNWIDAGYGVVPTEFGKLVEAVVPEGELKRAINDLIAAKARGFESSVGPRIESVSEYLEGELLRLTAEKPGNIRGTGDPEELNRVFYEVLAESWRVGA